MSDTAADDVAAQDQVFEQHRAELTRIAYRMLGSWSDAEDVVQETWLRWRRVDLVEVDRPVAYLVRITTRLAIDLCGRADRRRETYIGPWLPEPASLEPAPDEVAEVAESLTLGFVAVLQRLGPVDRAVFLLHEVFGWSHADVAVAVGRSEAACRQIARRARGRVRDERRGARFGHDADLELLGRAVEAVRAGDVDTVTSLLSADCVLVSDGGPSRHAARVPVVGADRVARFLIGIARRPGWTGEPPSEIESGWVNGQLGLLFVTDGVPTGAMVADSDGDRLVAVTAVVAPEKAHRLERMGG